MKNPLSAIADAVSALVRVEPAADRPTGVEATMSPFAAVGAADRRAVYDMVEWMVGDRRP